ncbi:hypothetical protein Tdes44962_MAKER05903 [Teratosphaeria destructans]|uniref:AHC1-like C2H2 zinc-finger domain-containing protein n=1 Tax=Teratosphaeria destructans TaxID=418781 RepID=A0A9W7VYK2_9PEZI|nr:hypothetical protein Tdes44962_MAKER05903 [Teratosphaeria destructans]
MAIDNMRSSPVPALAKLKRKRSTGGSPEPYSPHFVPLAKKPRVETTFHASQSGPRLPVNSEREQTSPPATATSTISRPPSSASLNAPVSRISSEPSLSPGRHADSKAPAEEGTAPKSDHAIMSEHPTAATDALGLTPLQQVIENEFNMQILLKHNELRLIEQELAKCQVALEQLRRCELRPYPGANGLSPAVSLGTGPAIAPPSGFTQPAHAAPYGVTDGPYTRHYRQWLLGDHAFDAVPQHASSGPSSARSTRHTAAARGSLPGSISMPGSATDLSFPAPPPPPPKDKSAPLVLRRSTDNQLVKLICKHCNRGNFSSIQGFLNHCRIAHKEDYKSHDAAAQDCGQLLDEQETANLPPEVHAAPAPKPSTSRSSSTTNTPLRAQHGQRLVHPMNIPGAPSVHQARSSASKPLAPVPRLGVSMAPSSSSATFTGSSQAPRLSAQFAKYNMGGNLAQAIASAKEKVDLGAEENASPDALDSASPPAPAAGTRMVQGTARPPSRKGYREPAQPRHRPSPLAPATFTGHGHGEIPESPQDHSSAVSPHTADSNPGMVSDHEDDDHASASEDEGPHAHVAPVGHPLGVRQRDCSDNMDIDIAVDDDMDQHGVLIRRNSMVAAETAMRAQGTGSTNGKAT